MKINVVIRSSEAAKVPHYTDRLQCAIHRSKHVGLKRALTEWGDDITKRRLAWLEEHRDCLKRLEGTEVRKGFQLVMVEYMGVPYEEIPIVEETETKITWRSHDFCPYLEAIQKLEADTKMVCKYATEAPVQAILNVLNTNLHFSRNYNKIRPYAPYCEETIELIDEKNNL